MNIQRCIALARLQCSKNEWPIPGCISEWVVCFIGRIHGAIVACSDYAKCLGNLAIS